MPDFAGIRIGSAIDAAVSDNSAADSGRERHVKQWIGTNAGAVEGLAKRAGIRIVVHHYRRPRHPLDPFHQRVAGPTAHVRRESYRLRGKIDGAAETDP